MGLLLHIAFFRQGHQTAITLLSSKKGGGMNECMNAQPLEDQIVSPGNYGRAGRD